MSRCRGLREVWGTDGAPVPSSLALRVHISLVLLGRNASLLRHGGGITPRSLLRAESIAFATTVGAGIAADVTCRGSARRRLRRLAGVTWWSAVLIHLIRFLFYLRRGGEIPRRG